MRTRAALIPAVMAILGSAAACAQPGKPDPAETARAVHQSTEAARAAVSAPPIIIHAPGLQPPEVVQSTPPQPAAPRTGTEIVVPANAVAGAVPVYAEGDVVYTDSYDDTVYVTDAPTVVEYETLIRAGGPPYFAISTLHTPFYFSKHSYSTPYYCSSPYYSRSYGYHHDRYSEGRSDRHYRPYSSRGPYSSYDPLGGTLHRDAMLRFHRASYPNTSGRSVVETHTPRGDFNRSTVNRGNVNRADDGGRGRPSARSDISRPITGYRRDARPASSSPTRAASTPGRSGSGRGDAGRSSGGGGRSGGAPPRSSGTRPRSGAARSPK